MSLNDLLVPQPLYKERRVGDHDHELCRRCRIDAKRYEARTQLLILVRGVLAAVLQERQQVFQMLAEMNRDSEEFLAQAKYAKLKDELAELEREPGEVVRRESGESGREGSVTTSGEALMVRHQGENRSGPEARKDAAAYPGDPATLKMLIERAKRKRRETRRSQSK